MTRCIPTLPEDQPVHIDVTDARQGVGGRHILIILAVSIGLAVLTLLAIWSLNWADLESADSASRPSPRPPAAAAGPRT